jgi:hypothetical protein
MDDPEVAVEMHQLKQLYFGDAEMPSAEDIPEGMTSDKFYEMFKRHVDIVNAAFDEVAEQARRHAPKGQERVDYMKMVYVVLCRVCCMPKTSNPVMTAHFSQHATKP